MPRSPLETRLKDLCGLAHLAQEGGTLEDFNKLPGAMKEDLPEGNEMARYTFYRHYSIFFDVCKKCMEGIDGNSSLLDNYDAQQIVDYVRDFAAAELQDVAKKAMDLYGGSE
ncbi:hypothetical protein SI65_00376 [Aspergillus cristatus]|uniref:Uncharacterized protein n=1 Tax=Aspergillus cristatus TaxID=573508 RepID=A0A1E3BPH9_ASPCR|nr:hypothetical protein SI65_00376 [Aspergillus cristatus]